MVTPLFRYIDHGVLVLRAPLPLTRFLSLHFVGVFWYTQLSLGREEISILDSRESPSPPGSICLASQSERELQSITRAVLPIQEQQLLQIGITKRLAHTLVLKLIPCNLLAFLSYESDQRTYMRKGILLTLLQNQKSRHPPQAWRSSDLRQQARH